jgi:hypothetical protein
MKHGIRRLMQGARDLRLRTRNWHGPEISYNSRILIRLVSVDLRSGRPFFADGASSAIIGLAHVGEGGHGSRKLGRKSGPADIPQDDGGFKKTMGSTRIVFVAR